MMTPRGLVGATLALWGFALGLPLVGAALGLAFEVARFASPSARVASRLAIVVRVALLLAVGSLVMSAVVGRFPHALYSWLRWLPAFVVVLPTAQVLAGGSIPLSAFVAALRPGTTAGEDAGVDTTFAFVAVTLVAAATGTQAGAWFYAFAAALAGWSLLARMPRARWLAGGALIALAVLLGFAVQRGLWTLQGELEEMDLEALQEFFDPKPDPFRERTRIGDVGRRKLNDRILMRVVVEGERPSEVLLRESAFDRYSGGEWKSSKRTFQPVPRQDDRWVLRDGEPRAHLTVRRSLSGGAGLLAIPADTLAIDHLPAQALEALPTGAVRAKGAPRFVSMRVAYGGGAHEPGSDAGDLEVPATLQEVLDRVISERDLRKDSPRATLVAVERYFAERFYYSLDSGASGRTLADFFLKEPRGHCEYFATGTTLLLRRLGIPARYSVGYSAQEYSAFEHAYLVRHRHAHAWASAFVDGRWITVDTTPARWAADEGEAARSPFAALLDAFSWALDRIVLWWVESPPADILRALAIVVAAALSPFAFHAVLRAWKRRRPARAAVALGRSATAWRAVETLLARRGCAREDAETPQAWARRMEHDARAASWSRELADLAREYYRVRFDPAASPSAGDEFVRATEAFRRRVRQSGPRVSAPDGA